MLEDKIIVQDRGFMVTMVTLMDVAVDAKKGGNYVF